ncbi:unnamed protein product, partial [marine sediment metagenome]
MVDLIDYEVIISQFFCIDLCGILSTKESGPGEIWDTPLLQ